MANWYSKSFRKGTNAFAKYYDGSQWVKKPIKFYDGTTWTTRNGSPTDIRAQLITDSIAQTALGATKYWNGSAWIVRDALAQESYNIVAKDASSGGNTITSVNEGSSVYFHITGREADETLYYQITSYLPSSNVKSINFANDFSAPSSSSGTITTGTDKVGILQVTTSADNDPENTPQDFQIEIYSDFNGSKGDLESFSNVITINDTSSAANPTTSGSYNNTYLGQTTTVTSTGVNDTGTLSFNYTIPSNTSPGHYYFVLWGGSSSYTKSTPNDSYGHMMTRFTLSLQINKDVATSIVFPTIYDSTELGFTKVTTPNGYYTINQVQVTNNTTGVSFDTGQVVPDADNGSSYAQVDDNYALDTVIHASPGDSLSFTVRMTQIWSSTYLRFNYNAF